METINPVSPDLKPAQTPEANGHSAAPRSVQPNIAHPVPPSNAGQAAPLVPVNAVGAPLAPPDAAPEAAHDSITRRRTIEGHRLGWVFCHSIPVIRDVSAAESHIEAAIQFIQDVGLVGRAHTLRHFWEDKLREALHNYIRVRDEEHQRMNDLNTWIASEHDRIQVGQETLRQQFEAAAAPRRAEIASLDAPLEAAHHEAADRCADTGGHYNPAEPDERCVLRHERMPLDALAGEQGIPGTQDDASTHIPSLTRNLATMLVGLMLGISIALMAGVLDADNLFGKPVALAAFCAIGWAAAYLGGAAIKHSHKYAAERFYLGHAWTGWAPFLALAVTVDATVLFIDSTVEQAGLLKTASIQNLAASLSGPTSGLGGATGAYTFAAVLLSFGYVIYYAWEGTALGRRHPVQNRLLAVQENRFREEDQRVRALPEVQTALRAIARVNELRRQAAQIDARIARTAVPFDEQIAFLEGQRRPLQLSLDQHAEYRIQDARDNLLGAQATFDRMYDDAMDEAEGRGPITRWFRRSLRNRSGRSRKSEPEQRS